MNEPIITPRPRSIDAEAIRIKTGCGNMYCILSMDPDIWEASFELGHSGCCARGFLEALGKFITLSRRKPYPLPRKLIIRSLEGIRCENDSAFLPSCLEAIARILKDKWNLKDDNKEEPE